MEVGKVHSHTFGILTQKSTSTLPCHLENFLSARIGLTLIKQQGLLVIKDSKCNEVLKMRIYVGRNFFSIHSPHTPVCIRIIVFTSNYHIFNFKHNAYLRYLHRSCLIVRTMWLFYLLQLENYKSQIADCIWGHIAKF